MNQLHETHIRYWLSLTTNPHLTVKKADMDYLHTLYVCMDTYWLTGADKVLLRATNMYDYGIYEAMMEVGRGSLFSWLLAAHHAGDILMDWRRMTEWLNSRGYGRDVRACLSLARNYVSCTRVLLNDIHETPISELG